MGKILPDSEATTESTKPFIGKFGADFVFPLEKLNVFGFSLTAPEWFGPIRVDGARMNISAELKAGDVVTATMSGLFIEVKKGHPAYYRWH